MQGPHSAAACVWPRWLTTLEYRFWATRLGLAVRVLAGHQQREYRLKVDQELGALKEERREMEDSCKCLYGTGRCSSLSQRNWLLCVRT